MSYELQVEAVEAIADWLDIPSSPDMVLEIQTSLCEGMEESIELEFDETSARIVCSAFGFDATVFYGDLERLRHADHDAFVEEVNSRFWGTIGKLEFEKLERILEDSSSSHQWN